MPPDETAASKRAWGEFCEALQAAGLEVLGNPRFTAAADRADGIAQLAQLLESGLRWHVLGGDGDFPRFVQINDTPEVADNLFAPVRADARYLIRGNIADLFDINISVHEGWGFVPGQGRRIWGDLGRADLAVDAEGNFELLLGPDVSQDDGLRLEPGASYVQIREYFADWRKHRPGRYEIIRLGSEGGAPPRRTLDAVLAGLGASLEWAHAYQRTHQRILETHFPSLPNAITAPERQSGGNRNIQYGFGRFDLGPGQALLVSFNRPRARLWTMQWLTRWYENPDMANHLTSLTSAHAHTDTDGIVRIVIAPEDPGCPNWLDCSGYAAGVFVTRWLWGEDDPTVTSHLAPLAELREQLPADHPHTTPRERRELQALRRSHLASRRR